MSLRGLWLMLQKILLGLACAILPLCGDEIHKFAGKHFLASYLDCDPKAISDVPKLLEAMDEAVNRSGATILDKKSYIFEPEGVTVVYLLSESHASLHTYPELGACFVDLFTCGDNCSAQGFDAALRNYLLPKEVNARFFLRNEEIQEIPLLEQAANEPLPAQCPG
jgi:S-adenosylmethionine decarboxylase